MNQQPSSPDEFDRHAPSKPIERRLQRLQPRPPAFDADAVIRAAEQRASEQRDAASRVDSSPRDAERDAVVRHATASGQPVVLPATSSARGPLATIAVSWACGAIAGALVTCLWLMPTGNERSASSPQTSSAGSQPRSLPSDSDLGSRPDSSSENTTDSAADRDFDRDDDARRREPPVWSRSEWLAVAQLSRLGDLERGGTRPMMAGNCLGLGTSLQASLSEIPSGRDHRFDASGTRVDEFPAVPDSSQIPRPDLLLQELLGTGRDSQL